MDAKTVSIAPEAPRFDLQEAVIDENQWVSYRAVQSDD